MSISNQAGETYERLGNKTFLIFLLGKLGFFFALLIVFSAVAVASAYIPEVRAILPSYFFSVSALILILAAAATFGIVWLEYVHYAIFIGEQNIEIRKGILTIEEMGIPFRKIRNVKSSRNIVDQLLGISHIVVTISGEDGDKEVDIVLPALEYDLAQIIQDSILKKSQIGEMKIEHLNNPSLK